MSKASICIICDKYSPQENESLCPTCNIKFEKNMKNVGDFHEDWDNYQNTDPTSNTNLTDKNEHFKNKIGKG